MGSSSESAASAVASPVSSVTSVDIELERLAARWRSEQEWAKVAAEVDAEPEPTHLNTINSSALFVSVTTDKLSARYSGSQQHGHDVGVVQANCPAPTRRIAYYFEMAVRNSGVKAQTAIGFTTDQFKMRRQPGWEVNSCGYHGDDGYLYSGTGKGQPFGPTFKAGDVIGAGINYATQEFFFTKNGHFVGVQAKDIRCPLYPTIAVHSENEEVTVNFGGPFVFDIAGYIFQQRLKHQQVTERIPLQPDPSNWIIRSYLLHYGYQDTLAAFDVESGRNSCSHENGFGDPVEMYDLKHRKILRQLIMNGEIDSVFLKLQAWYPQLLQDEFSVIFLLLYFQGFIEYIRDEQPEEALKYARDNLSKFYSCQKFEGLLKETVSLLAYEDPAASCVSHLLSPMQRELVADAVNAAVMTTNPNLKDLDSCMSSSLEKLLRQLTACSVQRQSFNEDQGEAFHLHRESYTHTRVKPL